MGNLPFAAYPFARERTHSITGRPRRDGADREKCVLPSPSSHKATLVNQPEMLITEEGGRADGQRREVGGREGTCTIDRSRESEAKGKCSAALLLFATPICAEDAMARFCSFCARVHLWHGGGRSVRL